MVATPNALTNTCGGIATATAGGSSINLTGGTLAAKAQCTVVVNVTGTGAGTKNNVSGAVSSSEGGTGGTASASIIVIPPDAYKLSYAANLGNGDSVVNLTNAGGLAGSGLTGYICANVYAFAEDEQLIACCSCPLSPNDLKTLSAQKDLISNTATQGVPSSITIAVLASTPRAGNTCDPTSPT